MTLVRRRIVHIRGVGSLVLDIRGLGALDHTTLIALAKLSLSSSLVAAIVPGVERQPLKKLKTDEKASLLGAK
jgi:hypothetical protein